MQLPIISRRGQHRPYNSIPRINWAHPLARGLVFYHYDAGGVDIGDLARNRPMAQITATSLGRASSQWGTAYLATSSNTADGVKYSSDAALRLAAPFSFAAGFYKTGTATEDTANFFWRNVNWAVCDNTNVGGVTGKAGIVVVGWTGNFVPAAAEVNNTYRSIIASVAATSANWWANGVAQTPIVGQTYSPTNTGDDISVGTDGFGPGGFQGSVFWGGTWNRSLTDAEALQLHLDPYCFLIYPEDEMFAMLVGAAAAAVTPYAAFSIPQHDGQVYSQMISY